jgi:hypothetical protein
MRHDVLLRFLIAAGLMFEASHALALPSLNFLKKLISVGIEDGRVLIPKLVHPRLPIPKPRLITPGFTFRSKPNVPLKPPVKLNNLRLEGFPKFVPYLHLDFNVTQGTIISILPEDPTAYRKIFDGKKVGLETQLRHIKTWREKRSSLGNVSSLGSVNDGTAALKAVLSRHHNSIIFVIAHSDEWRNLRLADGTKVSTIRLHQLCSQAHVGCILLTCRSADLNIAWEISIREAFAMASQGLRFTTHVIDTDSQRARNIYPKIVKSVRRTHVHTKALEVVYIGELGLGLTVLSADSNGKVRKG